jgi:DNA adenine methylase
MSGNKNKVIAFNYFGGKFSHVDSIYPYFPQKFIHLIDLFAGSLAVSLNYTGKVIKTANEINYDITNFFEVLRDHTDELIDLLRKTPISQTEYNRCWTMSGNSIEDARRYYVRVRQSFFGLGAQRKNKGWHMAKTQLNCNAGESVSKFVNGVEGLNEVAERLRGVFQILNDDYSTAIEKLDFRGAFFYCDPPYPRECRASFNDYRFEFHDEDHLKLSESLHKIEGMAMISSYECNLMNELYSDWTKIKLPRKKNNIRSGEVQEVIWFNYPIEQCSKYKIDLFNQYT